MSLKGILDSINSVLWSNYMIYFALLSGVLYTFLCGFGQFRRIPQMVKYMFEANDAGVGRTPFQAFALTLATRVGTGNIAGVASAIFTGGPGAVFWMWVLALLGAATTIFECSLSQVYKSREGDEFRGGAQYFIDKGLGIKWFAVLFAVASVVALGFCTPGIQANAIADATNIAFGINKTVVSIVLVGLVALTIFGGVKRIARVTEYLGPIMAGAFILIALVIMIVNIAKLPGVIGLIVRSAFGKDQVFGGIIGTAIMMGVKRGIYSNEAGMGTAAQAAATPHVSHPVKQGLVQAMSVYIDTIFVCSATAFMILLTGMYNVDGLVSTIPHIQAGPGFSQMAVDTLIPGFGSVFVAVSMFFFAFSTILGNYYAAETGVAYLASKFNKSTTTIVINVLRVATCLAILLFAAKESAVAWALGDVGIGVTTWLNLIAMLLLVKQSYKIFKDFETQFKATGDATFKPEAIGIKNTDPEVW